MDCHLAENDVFLNLCCFIFESKMENFCGLLLRFLYYQRLLATLSKEFMLSFFRFKFFFFKSLSIFELALGFSNRFFVNGFFVHISMRLGLILLLWISIGLESFFIKYFEQQLFTSFLKIPLYFIGFFFDFSD